MQGGVSLSNERFYDLVETIFNKTLGIKKDKNHERGGSFSDLFYSDQLGRDLKAISVGKPIRDPNLYIGAINGFFKKVDSESIEKTSMLIGTLEMKGFLIGLEGADILSKCDRNTIGTYKKLLLDIWNYYYGQYSSESNTSNVAYSISQDLLDSIIQKYVEFRLPVSLDFYQQRIPDILEALKIKDPDSLYSSIETEYVYFFKNVLENQSFYTLSREERTIFFNTLYTISDILDKTHHKDSYSVNLEILSFLNDIYDDDFTNISVDDIRRIQGCLYAISIETTDESLQGNIKLTKNGNMTRDNKSTNPITYKSKLDICDQALRNLLKNKKLQKLHIHIENDNYISLYENRLQRNRNVSVDEINELYVLSLVYSNIAACTLQYIKQRIDIDKKLNDYIEICETYHDKSQYIRNLIVRITKKIFGEASSEYNDSLHFMATYYHSLATRYYYMKKYADSIAIRGVLYNFYMSLDLKKKAQQQLDLAPISLYEQSGGNSKSYEITTRNLFSKRKKDFSFLVGTKIISYDDFSILYREYQIAKKFL